MMNCKKIYGAYYQWSTSDNCHFYFMVTLFKCIFCILSVKITVGLLPRFKNVKSNLNCKLKFNGLENQKILRFTSTYN